MTWPWGRPLLGQCRASTYIGDGGLPGNLSKNDALWAFHEALDNITESNNNCGNTYDHDFTNKPTADCSNEIDIRSVGTHEAGHLFGLKDIAGAHDDLTMFGSSILCSTRARTLGKGDVLGLRSIYRAGADAPRGGVPMKAVLPIGRRGPVGMLLAAATFTVSVACTSSSDSEGGESASSCASLVEYQNRTYSGTEARGFTVGDKLGAATLPPCDDTPSDDSDGETTPTSTTAHAIEGVDPSIAIMVEQASDDVIFVNVDSDKKLPEIKKLIHGS
ncbi:DUF6281 family protein [Streptomyces sp. SD15]